MPAEFIVATAVNTKEALTLLALLPEKAKRLFLLLPEKEKKLFLVCYFSFPNHPAPTSPW